MSACSNLLLASGDKLLNDNWINLIGSDSPRRIILIVGFSSSGKSTLVNHLYGTKFPVNDGTNPPRRGPPSLHGELNASGELVLEVNHPVGGLGASIELQRVKFFAASLADTIIVNIGYHHLMDGMNCSDPLSFCLDCKSSLDYERLPQKQIVFCVRDLPPNVHSDSVYRVLPPGVFGVLTPRRLPRKSVPPPDHRFDLQRIALPKANIRDPLYNDRIQEFRHLVDARHRAGHKLQPLNRSDFIDIVTKFWDKLQMVNQMNIHYLTELIRVARQRERDLAFRKHFSAEFASSSPGGDTEELMQSPVIATADTTPGSPSSVSPTHHLVSQGTMEKVSLVEAENRELKQQLRLLNEEVERLQMMPLLKVQPEYQEQGQQLASTAEVEALRLQLEQLESENNALRAAAESHQWDLANRNSRILELQKKLAEIVNDPAWSM